MNSSTHFSLITLNVNGLNDVRKRRLVFTTLKKLKRSVILLQETHCRPGNARLWKSQWGHDMLLTDDSASSGGVAILFSRDLNPIIKDTHLSHSNRFIMCRMELEGAIFKVFNVYMPTADKEREQIEILGEISKFLPEESEADETIILGGDFNVSMNDSLDRKGYSTPSIRNLAFRDNLEALLDSLDLCDLWRIQNPSTKAYTWSRAHKMARLDYIFIPYSFGGHLQASNPRSFSFSDHRLVAIDINPLSLPKGKGFWRMKASLLNREDFRIKMRVFLVDKIKQTSDLPPDTRWDFLKLGIREFSMKYYSELKRKNAELERALENRLEELEKEMPVSDLSSEEYQSTKRELFQIQLLEARESMIRSRTKWVSLADRPSKYFLNLEKKNFEDRTVASIFNDDGVLLTQPHDVLAYQKLYFSKQQAASSHSLFNPATEVDPFSQSVDNPIEETDRQELNTQLTLDELERALKLMKAGKSPGSDGIPSEFFRAFWDLVGPLLLAALSHSLDKGFLSPDQRRAVVTLIPKKGRDKRYLSNWRPISVLNTDYKLLAKAMALRLSTILPKIIHYNQTGFVKNRYIGDSIKNTHSIFEFLESTGRQGLILSLDFKAAFDSLDHSYLFRILQAYGVGQQFFNWTRVLYADTESSILNRGISSGWFPFKRGIRQGCPLSPLLFVLAVERLADSIRANSSIRGIDILDSHTKLQQFADDTTLFVRDESSLLESLETISEFSRFSGLHLNLQKTQAINIGDIQLSSNPSREIIWRNSVKILGIVFSKENNDLKDYQENFLPALNKMKSITSDWTWRNISLKGKTVILNSLIFPIIHYQCTMLHVTPRVISEINKITNQFLWNGKRPKISRACLELPPAKGGYNLHNISYRIKTCKVSWVKRAARPQVEPWHFYWEFKTDRHPYELFHQRICPKRLQSFPFLLEVFRAWKEIYNLEPNLDAAIRNEPIHNNPKLVSSFTSAQSKFLYDNGITKVHHILDRDRIVSQAQLTIATYGTLPGGLMDKLDNIIPPSWLAKLLPINKNIGVHSVFVPLQNGKDVPLQALKAKKKEPYTCKARWQKLYGQEGTFP